MPASDAYGQDGGDGGTSGDATGGDGTGGHGFGGSANSTTGDTESGDGDPGTGDADSESGLGTSGQIDNGAAFGGDGIGGDAIGGNASSGSALGGDGGFGTVSHDYANGISMESRGGDGGDGGTSGNAAGGNGTGGDGTGGDAEAGESGIAQGGDGFGGDGFGGEATSGDASGGAGGAGGNIGLVNLDQITTQGDDEHGISAISDGGDGGDGGTSGDAFGGNGTGGDGTGGDAEAGDEGIAEGGDGTGGDGTGGDATSGDALGGDGGAGGNIGINNHGRITTEGDGAHGISAVSRGGDGGAGGTTGNAEGGDGTGGGGEGGEATAGVDGTAEGGDGFGGDGTGGDATSGDASGGAGGDGGDIGITNYGRIITEGDGAHGISAVSRGGDGGDGGTSGDAFAGDGAGGSGTGGEAIVASGGNDEDGDGIGGDGDGGNATSGNADGGSAGSGGIISIRNAGLIHAHGVGSHGIFASSPGGDIDILLSSGEVIGGTGDGAGIHLFGESDNLLTLRRNAYLGALSNLALETVDGETTVNNRGTVEGDVATTDGTTWFNNLSGGRFLSGESVNLGDDGVLRNAGVLSPGGTGNAVTTELTGDFVQHSGGTYLVDADFHNTIHDSLNVNGTAELDGSVQVHLLNLQHDNQTLTVLEAADLIDNGVSVIDTAVVSYSGDVSEADNWVRVSIEDIDFSPSGLTFNQTSTGTHLHSVYRVGESRLDPALLEMANIVSMRDYAATLDRLHPEPYLGVAFGTLRAANRFSGMMLDGCGSDLAGPGLSCVWGHLSGSWFDQDRGTDRIGVAEDTLSIAAGFERRLNEIWRVGAAIGYESSSMTFDHRGKASTDRVMGGAMAKAELGAWTFGLGASGGYGSSDVTRHIGLDAAATAWGDVDTRFISGRARADYRFGFAAWDISPRLDLDVTHLRMDGVNEFGAGPLNLITGSVSETVFTGRPGVEIAREFDLADGGRAQPSFYGGLAWRSDSRLTVDAVFDGTPSSVDHFTIRSEIDEVVGEFGLGLDVNRASGATFGVGYRIEVGNSSTEHRANVNLSMPF